MLIVKGLCGVMVIAAIGMILVVMEFSSMRNDVPAANGDVRLFIDKLRPASGGDPVMDDEKKPGVDRRAFLKTAVAGAGATAAAAAPLAAAAATQVAQAEAAPKAKKEGAHAGKADAAHEGNDMVVEHPGSDFMVDVIKTLGLEYMATNPGSSFRSLHESLVNYGGNQAPELLTCMHEESAIAMAHG